MTLEYDGAGFHGWQTQRGARTVQQTVEEALALLLPERPDVIGSGRTDAGVHARGQVAHFRIDAVLESAPMMRALNGMLRPDVAVRAFGPAPSGFHARFDARERRYHYHVSIRPFVLGRNARVYLAPTPDFARMNAAALVLLGRRDFSAFCRARSETTNRVCDLRRACWTPEDEAAGFWRFEIAADRFLHGMVRAIVGSLLEVGRGRRSEAGLRDALASGDRRRAGAAAPARGLVLHEVLYEPPGPYE